MMQPSLDEDICLVQFLDILLNFRQLPLIILFSAFESRSVNQSHMGHLLVLLIDLIPLSLESLTNFVNLFLRENLSI